MLNKLFNIGLALWTILGTGYAQVPDVVETMEIKAYRRPWTSSSYLHFALNGSFVTYPPGQKTVVIYPTSDYMIYPEAPLNGKAQSIETLEQRAVKFDFHELTSTPYSKDIHPAYPFRYQTIEHQIMQNVSWAIRNPGSNQMQIVITPFYNRVYFSDIKALAYYTISGIDNALKACSSDVSVRFIILSGGNKELETAFQNEYDEWKELEHEEKTHTKLESMVTFRFETAPDLSLETYYHLHHLDELLKEGKLKMNRQGSFWYMNEFDLAKLVLGNNQSAQGFLAPERVIVSIQNMIKVVFKNGSPDLLEAERIVRKIFADEFKDHTDKQSRINFKTQEVMGILRNGKAGIFSKLDLFYAVFKENASYKGIEKSLRNAVKW